MQDDFGIKVSTKNSEVATAALQRLLFTTRYPFCKLDQTKPESFRNISIFFNTELTANVKTLVYQFAHGYTNRYPQTWFLAQSNSADLTTDNLMQEGGLVRGNYNDGTTVSVEVDKTNVYIYFYKSQLSTPTTIAGVTVKIRCYIFVDDLGL